MVKTVRSVVSCICTIAVLSLAAAVFTNALFADEPDTRADKVLDGFVKGIEQNANLDDAQRSEVLGLIERQRSDEYLRTITISEALSRLYPEFRGALEALAEEETDKAIKTLAELAQSKDLYLSAEASYYLARAHMMEERCEDALPLLERLTGDLADKTLFVGNSRYLLGTSQAQLLQRKQAIASLRTFLKNNPNASERLRVGAFRQIAQLESVQKGSLDDVQDRMNFSRRKLALEHSGDRTRGEQDTIVAMLDVLIKEAEDKEKKGGGSGPGPPGGGPGGQGGIQPGSGADQSTAPEGAGSIGSLRRRNSSRNAWDVTRSKERDRVLAGLKGKFPDRYRKLIEQYYKNLQDEEK